MENAELYTLYNTFQKRDAANVLAEFAAQLTWTEDEKVLDIGCGPGDVSTEILLPQLPKHISSFVGVDISSNMIKFAKKKYSNEKVTFKTLDFASKEVNKHFPEKHFTKIFSFHCLHWIQDLQQFAQNLYNVLRPGGKFLGILCPSSQFFRIIIHLSEIDHFKYYCQDMENVVPPMFYSKNPRQDLKRTFTAQGLDVIKCELRMTSLTYPNLEAIAKAFEACSPFVKNMPDDVKGKYSEAIKQSIKNPPIENNPQILPSGEVRFLNAVIVVFACRH